ncbi:GNAT family N-acetyltransferase [Pedobacter duraquae]|uniref:Acetyltransferase (GNAT) family protein n=1 Tax=Pedobacter duraquae TaxID=425511 RepID=A0A4R6INT4_9SPHI|nr:GNAT family N-acetyltransferase [Pedobacter duraquae]TDO23781.1 acetyltransferase (GNAT) family protein [Pedobacter duraquae]
MKVVLLQKHHNREIFDSETPLLDNYFKKQASQDVRKDLSACYVLADEKGEVFGYYTLASNSVSRDDMPDDLIRKFPNSYSDLPTILLGRLAVDKRSKGKGYGSHLLMDAMERCLALSDQLGTLALVVDPIDENAVRFYKRFGFILIPDTGKMFIAMQTIRKSFN